MVLPTTLQIASVGCPFRFISRRAASVSMVSPLCVIANSKVFIPIGGLRYRSSLAYSTSTGIRAKCSIMYSPTSAECQLVPQAVSTIDRPEVLYHYPASQASLAKVVRSSQGHDVAERFELYYHGIELANGFHELGDAVELRKRFEAVNAARLADGRRALPMPERLLAALNHGLPDCTGVALGFDRLVMLALGATSIDEVVAFPSEKA